MDWLHLVPLLISRIDLKGFLEFRGQTLAMAAAPSQLHFY